MRARVPHIAYAIEYAKSINHCVNVCLLSLRSFMRVRFLREYLPYFYRAKVHEKTKKITGYEIHNTYNRTKKCAAYA